MQDNKEEKQINFGLIEEPRQENDYIAGIASPLSKVEVFKDGHGWGKYLPVPEMQFNGLTDYMDCVTESFTNCIEMLQKAFYNVQDNYSERFTAKLSGTTRQGNSLRNVAESGRKQGLVLETEWPRNKPMTWEEYYATIPQAVIQKGLKFVKDWTINYEWIDETKEAFKQALKYGLIQVTGYAWLGQDGIFYDWGRRANHAFVIYDYVEGEYWLAYDSYPTDYELDNNSTQQEFIKKIAWNFKFGSAMQFTIKPNLNNNESLMAKIKNMFKKIARDAKGGLWFLKDGKKQKIENWLAFSGAVIDEIGVTQNNLTEDQLKLYQDTKFFG